jgi:hypothetical protein
VTFRWQTTGRVAVPGRLGYSPRVRRFLSLVVVACALACATRDDRGAVVTDTFVRTDEVGLRYRGSLYAGKYHRMESTLFDFYRGALPLFLRDATDPSTAVGRSAFSLAQPMPLAIGDAHYENFGVLRAGDGTFRLEPNDFDASDRWPYLYDVRRLVTSLVLAARLSNPTDAAARALTTTAARSIAHEAALAYATAIVAAADGHPPGPVLRDPNLVLGEDLFKRGERDATARVELDTLTVVDGTTRRLRRGAIDPAEPTNDLVDLPAMAVGALASTLATARARLDDPRDASFFTILDAARERGSGVASWPRVRVLVLVRGPSDDLADDVVLEVKEIGESGAREWIPPGRFFDGPEQRIDFFRSNAWSRSDADPFWTTARWLDFRVQVRTEAESNKTLRVSRLEGARGTADALTAMGKVLGTIVARVHATALRDGTRPGDVVGAFLRGREAAFADEQADVAMAYADQVTADWDSFRNALVTLGPTLGFPRTATDSPSPDLAAVIAAP